MDQLWVPHLAFQSTSSVSRTKRVDVLVVQVKPLKGVINDDGRVYDYQSPCLPAASRCQPDGRHHQPLHHSLLLKNVFDHLLADFLPPDARPNDILLSRGQFSGASHSGLELYAHLGHVFCEHVWKSALDHYIHLRRGLDDLCPINDLR
jgi:hypothetical protein